MRKASTTFLGRLIQGINYRLQSKKKDNNPYRLSALQTILLKHKVPGVLRQTKIGAHTLFFKEPMELYHCYEEILLHNIYDFQTGNKTPRIIDCGANMGIAVCYFKDKYPGAEITAFEPDEQNFELLKLNTAKYADVKLEKKAVWITNGVISFEQTGTMASRINEKVEKGKGETACVRLADLLQTPVDFLKIDIEGAEYEVLKDCAGLLPNVNTLFVEYHGYVNATNRLSTILEIVENAGFKVYIKMANDILPKPFIDKRLQNGDYEVQLNIFCYR